MIFFLALRWLGRRKLSLSGLLQDAAAAFLLSWLPLFLSLPFYLAAMVDSALWRHGRIRLSLSHGAHFLSAKSFWSSAKRFSVWPECLSALLLLVRPWDSFFFFGVAFLLFPFRREEANILFLLLAELRRRKPPPANFPPPLFSGERFRLLDPSYPLLRKTLAFTGEKRFDLRIDPGERPNVVFLFLESFRAKEIAELAPHFKRLSKEGIYFSQFQSNGTRTSQAAISALYGIPPSSSPSYLYSYLDIPLRGVPDALAEIGYETCLVQGGHLTFCRTADFFRGHNFAELYGSQEILRVFPKAPATSWGCADAATFQFAADLLQTREKPIFMALFTMTHHHPWRHPTTGEFGFEKTYSYTDECLGAFFQMLDEPTLRNTVFFLFGDHGQELGEHDPFPIYNQHLYQENVHVPLLISAKGRIERPQIIEEPASQIDLLPTVFDLFGLQSPHHSLGRSLCRSGESTLFSTHPNNLAMQAIRKGRIKYILHTQSGAEESYDLVSDPDEKTNLGPSPLKQELLAYGSALDSLYFRKQFCPPRQSTPSKTSLSLKGRLDITDKTIGSHLHENLLSLDLSGCLLLTDEGIESALHAAPRLEEISLQGITDFTGALPADVGRELAAIDARDCPNLSAASAAWIASRPRLWGLKLDGVSYSKQEYKQLGQFVSQLENLEIQHAFGLDDEALEHLFHAQKEVANLTLQNAPFQTGAILKKLPLRFKKCTALYVEQANQRYNDTTIQ